MVRSSLAFVIGLFTVASAAANGLPPPVPGKRYVPAEHVITTEKAYPEFDFYLVTGGSPKLVTFGPKDSVRIGPQRQRGFGSRIQLVAVLKGAAEKYEQPAAFAEALSKGTVPGYAATKERFESPTLIDAMDTNSKSTTVTHVVERIDVKAGIVFRAVPEPPGPRKSAPEPPGPRGGGVVAGLAVALAMGFAGLRLTRRRA